MSGWESRRLNEEAVQHGAIVAVVVESVHQLFVAARLLGMRAPDDALVEVRDAQPVVLRVEGEQQLIEAFRHVVDAAGVGGMENLPRRLAAVVQRHFDVQIALGNGRPGGGVAVHAHRPQMHHVGVQFGRHQRVQQVVGGVDVVVDGVGLVQVALHRIGRGALLREMDHGIRPPLPQPGLEPFVFGGDVDVLEAERLAARFAPDAAPLLNGIHRRERLHAELGVDPAPTQVVHDGDIVPLRREVQRRRPADEAVSAEYRDPQVPASDQGATSAEAYSTAAWNPSARRTGGHLA